MRLTGKQRLSVVVGAAWLIFIAVATEPWNYYFPYGGWIAFLVFGVAPIAIVVAFLWVRQGFRTDRKERA